MEDGAHTKKNPCCHVLFKKKCYYYIYILYMIYYTYCHIWKLTIRLLSLFPGDISFSPSCVRNKQRTNAVVVTLFCLFCCFFPRQFQMPWCVLFAKKNFLLCCRVCIYTTTTTEEEKAATTRMCVDSIQ